MQTETEKLTERLDEAQDQERSLQKTIKDLERKLADQQEKVSCLVFAAYLSHLDLTSCDLLAEERRCHDAEDQRCRTFADYC